MLHVAAVLNEKKQVAFPIRGKLIESSALIEKADEVATIVVMKNEDIKTKQF